MQKSISENSSSSHDSSNDNKFELAEKIAILKTHKWLIACVLFLTLLAGIALAYLKAPVYESDAMLQVEAFYQPVRVLDGGEGGANLKNDIPIMAEIELVNSRTVLSEAIKNLKLDIDAQPRYFPFFGGAIARKYIKKHKGGEVSSPLFGLSQFAWGGEIIKVDTFIVPNSMLDEKLTLIADKHGYFRLLQEDTLLLEGEVGKLYSKQIGNQDENLSIFVSQLNARENTQFSLVRHSENKAVELLRSSLQVTEKTKLSRILYLKMEGQNPKTAAQILNEIINVFVRQSVEQKSEEAQKTLEFLEKQMPLLKEQLEISTQALNNYQVLKGSIDLNLETQGLLGDVVKIKTETTLLQQKRDELRQRFTDSHPSIVALDKQIARLQGQVNNQEQRIQVLPETQQVIVKLSRDVKVNTELYTELLNKAQTLRVAKAGTVGDVRIVDDASLTHLPIKPKKSLIIALSFIIGLFLAAALAFLCHALRRGVEDPDLIENNLNIPVYATIPHSFEQEKLNKILSKEHRVDKNPVLLALQNKDDIAIESLRSLRTTLHFAFLEAQNNIIMITGPSPGVGKTFVSMNLAAVLADSGKKILLIDADMRKGYLNKVLGVDRENGLSELISNTNPDHIPTLAESIHKIPTVNFDFISTGAIPPNPSELLLHERFAKLLESISKDYDTVIIDSPPILAVTDASIIGRLASATLMVVKSGKHPMRELEHSAKRITQGGVSLKGIVFNDIPESTSRYGNEYGYTSYMYQYGAQKPSWTRKMGLPF